MLSCEVPTIIVATCEVLTIEVYNLGPASREPGGSVELFYSRLAVLENQHLSILKYLSGYFEVLKNM